MKFFYVLKQINEFTYSLKIHGRHISQIYKLIKKIIISSYYDSETESIFFSAENVMAFNQYIKNHTLKLNQCIKMMNDLTYQMNYLKNINYGFCGFDANDIIIIDNLFLFCNTQYLFPLQEDNFVLIEPMNNPYFSNPEIIKLTTLPAEINYKCCYYSLGVLVVFCLLNNYLLVSNELKTPEEIENIMKPIFNTKIYWFLKRCLEPNLEKRVLLLI